MMVAAASMQDEYDEDNPEIDPIHTPELYAALLQAAGERNRRIARRRAWAALLAAYIVGLLHIVEMIDII